MDIRCGLAPNARLPQQLSKLEKAIFDIVCLAPRRSSAAVNLNQEF